MSSYSAAVRLSRFSLAEARRQIKEGKMTIIYDRQPRRFCIMVNENGTPRRRRVWGEAANITGFSLPCFIHLATFHEDGAALWPWRVTVCATGSAIGMGRTYEEAVVNAEENTKHRDTKTVIEAAQKQIAAYGACNPDVPMKLWPTAVETDLEAQK